MATTLTISFAAPPDVPVRFAARCVGCNGGATTTSTLAFAKVVTNRRGTERPVRVSLAVPHCGSCARATKAVFLAALVPFALGFLLVGGAVLAGVSFGAAVAGLDSVGKPNNANSLVLGAAAGLAAGLVAAFGFELAARVVLLPLYGATLWRAPLLVPSLFTDADYVAGLAARPNADLSGATFTFARDDVAQAVAAANAGRLLP